MKTLEKNAGNQKSENDCFPLYLYMEAIPSASELSLSRSLDSRGVSGEEERSRVHTNVL